MKLMLSRQTKTLDRYNCNFRWVKNLTKLNLMESKFKKFSTSSFWRLETYSSFWLAVKQSSPPSLIATKDWRSPNLASMWGSSNYLLHFRLISFSLIFLMEVATSHLLTILPSGIPLGMLLLKVTTSLLLKIKFCSWWILQPYN